MVGPDLPAAGSSQLVDLQVRVLLKRRHPRVTQQVCHAPGRTANPQQDLLALRTFRTPVAQHGWSLQHAHKRATSGRSTTRADRPTNERLRDVLVARETGFLDAEASGRGSAGDGRLLPAGTPHGRRGLHELSLLMQWSSASSVAGGCINPVAESIWRRGPCPMTQKSSAGRELVPESASGHAESALALRRKRVRQDVDAPVRRVEHRRDEQQASTGRPAQPPGRPGPPSRPSRSPRGRPAWRAST